MDTATTTPTATIRELIAELATTEDAVRASREAPGTDRAERRERALRRQASIVRELRRRRVRPR